MRVPAGDNRYLGIQCSPDGEERHLTVYRGQEVLTALRYFKGGDEDEFMIPVPEGSEAEAEDSFTLYKERPERKKSPFALHYTPEKGWVNDPNGLILYKGVYHLYYQHNPLSRKWNNLSWGHAVSKDLVHWREEDPVFLPEDLTHLIYTGSATVEDGKMAVYYTLWDSEDDSKNAVIRKESDDGYHFTGRRVLLSGAGAIARDPKVFWHKGEEYILLFLEGHEFGLCKEVSGEWQVTCRFSVPEGWECPNIASFPDSLYFFTGEGYYWQAELEDNALKLKGSMGKLFLNRLPYASQVFDNTPGRQILVPWLMVKTPSLKSAGCMGIPREITEKEGRLQLPFAKEALGQMRFQPFKGEKEVSARGRTNFIFLDKAESFSGILNGNPVSYDKASRTLSVNGESVRISPEGMALMTDSLVLEVSAAGYTENAYFELDEGEGCHITASLPMDGATGQLRGQHWQQ